ncbi:MAG: hypothetical protein JXX28_15715 [Deltaproteobacteria bacterium]|nr:hypothetical protein [Deltaproteobacteria bacterium]
MWTLLSLPLLLACTDPPDDTGPVASSCGDSAPVISAVTARDNGLMDFSGESLPTVLIQADTADADGDLDWYTLQVWWDEDVDGQVDVAGAPSELYDSLSDTACSVDDARLGLILAINGRSIPYLTEVEFAVIAQDAAGHRSNDGEPMLLSWTTPDSQGVFAE